MSRNGSGTYTLPNAAFVAGTTIDPTPMNGNFSDIGAQITNSVAADGQTTMSGALKMGGQNIQNAGTVGVGGALNVTGTAAVGGALTATGAVAVGGALTVTGATALSSTLAVTGAVTGAAGIKSTGLDSGGMNFRATATNYGIGWRNDDSNFYLLMTNSGTPNASFNALRPFVVTLSTGDVAMGGTLSTGAISTTGTMAAVGAAKANGYTAKGGTVGAYRVNVFNIDWNGSVANLYIDSVNIGSFAYTSDPRIKQHIADAPGGALDRVMQWRVIEYEFADVDQWRADGVRHLGFDAAQLRQINEKIVTGAPDDLTTDGGVQPMTLNVLPMLAEITAALQSVVLRVEALEHTSR